MPDIIFYNGTILTIDPDAPQVEALAVRSGRILARGTKDELADMARPDTTWVDLDGRCLLPGFHDSHVHLTRHGLELSRLDLSSTPTQARALEQVAERAADLPVGSWILGSGFATSRWNVDTLHKEDLDRAAPEHPVLLQSQDHHSAWANSAALRLANVHVDTPDPQHGTIERHPDGDPSGLLLERAVELVFNAVPEPSAAELADALDAAAKDLARLGVTTVHHMAYEPASYWRALGLRASREDYPLRVWACVPQEDAESAAAIGLATGQGGERFCVGGAKFFVDGALGSLTAAMLEPYLGTTTTGVFVHGPDILAERLPIVIDAGLTPVVHAIGDAATRAVIDALEATLPQWQAKHLRPRVEHVQHLHPDDVSRFARLGAVASVQPSHLIFDAKRIRDKLGDRVHHAYPLRSLLNAGVHLAFGSDTPVAKPDTLESLRAACRRLDPDGAPLSPGESLAPDQALTAYTWGAAYAIGREHRSGQLRTGFDADFTVLSHNPLVSLDALSVEGTMVAGMWTLPLS
ncbi:MAG: amidohydrolase [Trueperaceae bacterium]|nr:amidohydrolase [Trueperaceae bacterium]